MQEKQVTLMDVIKEGNSYTGYEMEKIIRTALNSLDDDEVAIARELDEKYFKENVEDNFKPLKFVYYRIGRIKSGEHILRRNLYLSPRASEYFSREDKTDDELREIVRSKTTVMGADLKRIVNELSNMTYMVPIKGSNTSPDEIKRMSFQNLSIQLAKYIKEYFVDCEKPIKDDVWYGISCKEYGTTVVYRDLNKSPRPQHNK